MMRCPTTKRKRSGATLVEYAIVIGMTFTLMLAIFEYSRFVMLRHLLDNAAREGARLAAATTNVNTATDIQNRVTTMLANQPLNNLNIQVYKADASGNNVGLWTDASFGEAIAVQIDGTYSVMLPTMGFLPDPVTLTARSIMRSEAN